MNMCTIITIIITALILMITNMHHDGYTCHLHLHDHYHVKAFVTYLKYHVR